MPNVFSHPYQLDESISNFRVVGWLFSFLFRFKRKRMFANSGEPDQTPRFAAPYHVLQCLLMFPKKDARLIWVKRIPGMSLIRTLMFIAAIVFNIHF